MPFIANNHSQVIFSFTKQQMKHHFDVVLPYLKTVNQVILLKRYMLSEIVQNFRVSIFASPRFAHEICF